MANWVKCTVRGTSPETNRSVFINLDNVISVSRGHDSSTTSVLYATGFIDDSEAGVISVMETPQEILGNEVVRRN